MQEWLSTLYSPSCIPFFGHGIILSGARAQQWYCKSEWVRRTVTVSISNSILTFLPSLILSGKKNCKTQHFKVAKEKENLAKIFPTIQKRTHAYLKQMPSNRDTSQEVTSNFFKHEYLFFIDHHCNKVPKLKFT